MGLPTDQNRASSEAAGRVISQHREWLVRVIAARLGRGPQVDDVLQEVALAATRSQRPPATEAEWKPWLCAIAVRQCALALRSERRRRNLLEAAARQAQDGNYGSQSSRSKESGSTNSGGGNGSAADKNVSASSVPANIGAGGDDPIYWLLAQESAALMRRAVDQLDGESRRLLVRKYVEGMTYGQLAAEYNVPPHVIEYRVTKAKNNLRSLAIALGLGEEDVK